MSARGWLMSSGGVVVFQRYPRLGWCADYGSQHYDSWGFIVTDCASRAQAERKASGYLARLGYFVVSRDHQL